MRKPSWLWSLGSAAFLAGCSFSASCGSHIDGPKVETFLKEKLTEGIGVAPLEVKCPSSEPLKKGTTFLCTAGFPGGIPATISMEQQDDKGFVVIKQVTGIAGAKAVEEEIAAGIAKQLSVEATAECGPRVMVAKKDGVVDCQLKAKDGSTGTVKVTFKDDVGGYGWELVKQPAAATPPPTGEMPKGPEEPNVPGQ